MGELTETQERELAMPATTKAVGYNVSGDDMTQDELVQP